MSLNSTEFEEGLFTAAAGVGVMETEADDGVLTGGVGAGGVETGGVITGGGVTGGVGTGGVMVAEVATGGGVITADGLLVAGIEFGIVVCEIDENDKEDACICEFVFTFVGLCCPLAAVFILLLMVEVAPADAFWVTVTVAAVSYTHLITS